MPAALFWTFASIMLFFGVMVIVNRSPVSSALSLVVCFLGLAALYISLDAFFLGVIQILVYYGFQGGNAVFPALHSDGHGDTWEVGMALFQQYKLPLQMIGALVVVATVGAVLLSKRELK